MGNTIDISNIFKFGLKLKPVHQNHGKVGGDGGRDWSAVSASQGRPQFSSVAQSCPTLCDFMDCSMPGFPVHHQLPELPFSSVTQLCPTLCNPTDCSKPASLFITNYQSLLKFMFIKSVIPSNHLILSSPSPPAFNLSQHLLQWVFSQGLFQ